MEPILVESGLVCDNSACDWEDRSLAITQECVGMSCPKCGTNVLTQEEYDQVVALRAIASSLQDIMGDLGQPIDPDPGYQVGIKISSKRDEDGTPL